ncbi:MAG TPA: flagellar motor protein [Chromatiaceae bacterium]|jgi:chemotaxis protein MotA|nr:flagellar motor protein [Chromatiaceae bacterium]HIN82566.1 flagellar motor protein [Chromatiales bacterium]HIA07668.1 flagellar motor protein [Chromatiaceae bacterium]HIB85093.1 flagellar motor protein [Chromatiaceae bacterium]HIO14456.1 flagellar motor protein [Chromatiales bacterium]
MDILSIVGVILGFMAILGGNALEGGHLDSLFNMPAFVIVVGGTIGAIMLQTPVKTFVAALKATRGVFFPPGVVGSGIVAKMIDWSNIARRDGLLGLEAIAETETDQFARKGLQLLVDGSEPESIRSSLEVELDARETRDLQAANVFEGMGGYSPTIGIIGAVMGLIHVMQNLADPSMLGAGIATAFVATIYGVGLANLFFLPVASKLKSQALSQSQMREMVIEGLISIAEGENPRAIESKLRGYLS